MTLSEAWHLTAGSTAPLLGGALLVYVPSYAIGLAIQLAAEAPLGSWLATLLPSLVNVLVGVAAISFLSLSYRFSLTPAHPASRRRYRVQNSRSKTGGPLDWQAPRRTVQGVSQFCVIRDAQPTTPPLRA